MTRTLFLGDLQAQYKIWRNDVLEIAEDVDDVIQLGNLISISKYAIDHKDYGRNEAILKLWEASREKSSFKRVMGRNEIAALNAPEAWTNVASNVVLRDMWLSNDAYASVALVDKDRLVTHGGLTHGEWVSIGRPTTAVEAASRLHDRYAKTLYQGDAFALTRKPNCAANPLWADPVMELYPSWMMTEETCPFDQVHGAETLNNYRGREAVASKISILHYLDEIHYRKFGSTVAIRDMNFIAVNPDLPTETVTSIPQGKAFYVENGWFKRFTI